MIQGQAQAQVQAQVQDQVQGQEVWLRRQDLERTNIYPMKLTRMRKKGLITARPAQQGKGGGYEYLLSSLPAEAQRKYLESQVQDQVQVQGQDQEMKELTARQEKIALARVDLINLYIGYQRSNEGNFLDKQFEFVRAYNNKAFPILYDILGDTSRGTLERWRKTYFSSGKDYRSLAPKYQIEKTTSVTPQQADVLVKLALNPNRPLLSEVVRTASELFRVRSEEPVLAEATYRRWIERWKRNNYDQWTFYRDGAKALNDKVLPYIIRDYDKIEVGDILVGDGHVTNFEIINPFTGKPKRMMMPAFLDMKSSMLLGWEVSPTENILSIAMAFYRAVLRLGKIPKVVYLDNGRAFKAKYFQSLDFNQSGLIGLFERLGVKVITAWPYHGQSKTIERFFRTFSELERMMPTYTGTSIEMKPPHLNRGEKLHRKLHEKINEGVSFDLLTAHRAIAWWADQYSVRPQQGHLDGKTPLEIFEAGKGTGVDKQQLHFLMMKEDIAQIYQNGIRFRGDYYWNDALYGLRDKVVIRYDLLDDAAVYVYKTGGDFICNAYKKNAVHPAAKLLGTGEDVKQLEQQLSLRNNLMKSTTTDARSFLLNEIYPATRKQLYEADVLQLKNVEETEREAVEAKVKKTGTDNINFEDYGKTGSSSSSSSGSRSSLNEEGKDWF